MKPGKANAGPLGTGVTRVEELAYELKIREVMTRGVIQLSPHQRMCTVAKLFERHRISGAPVLSGAQLLGIVSLEDLIRSLKKGDLAAPVCDYMTTKPIVIAADDSVINALELFAKSGVGRFPVVDEGGELVGIITKGDITTGLLSAVKSEVQEEEIRRYRASHLFEDIVSDRTSLILRYRVQPRDFAAGGQSSANIKRALLRLGANQQVARRCAIACYEAEMNLIIHTTNGGILRVEIQPHMIYIEALDDGPGIEDVEKAKKPGYSTAPEEIRALGFGAGFGLTNIERCVDKMWLESSPGKGTRLEMRIYLEPDAQHRELEAIFERIAFRTG
jgi:CBS domain-containing protein/anti-sigma regulatory factor (Ser/Thr protein kinase)